VETNTGDLNIPDFNFSEFTGGAFDTSASTSTSNTDSHTNYSYPQSQSQPTNHANANNTTTTTTIDTTHPQQHQQDDLSDVSFGAMSFFPTPSFYADPHPDRLPGRRQR
jgi:hypothetical protein